MNKKIKLGLIFTHNEQWVGGTYYILNLISALNLLPDCNKPTIIILSKNKSDFDLANQTGYPYINFKNPYINKRNIFEKIIDKLSKIFFGKYIIDKRIPNKDIDVLFPSNFEYAFEKINHKIFWFADFQHVVYPNYFTADELLNRENYVKAIASTSNHLILSSMAAKSNYDSLNIEKKCKIHVMPFAVTHTFNSNYSISELIVEFNLQPKYFIVSNQFWAHKNHLLVLKAIKLLKQKNINIQVVFTGKENDYRNENYFLTIKEFIEENNITHLVKLLGLIDREKQLVLMKHAVAVIQPSLFEGWSTVVEDAKSLGCKLILSDIDVHKEQVSENVLFFDVLSEFDLATQIEYCLNNSIEMVDSNYQTNIQAFGENFYNIIQQATS